MLTADLRHAIGRAAGVRLDPGLRSHRTGGAYSSTAPFTLARGRPPVEVAAVLAAKLSAEPWIDSVEVTGSGFLTITVTRQALENVPGRVISAGEDCVTSDALAGQVAPPAPKARPEGWNQARDSLAAELTPRLAAAAGSSPRMPVETDAMASVSTGISRAIAYAGADAVRFALARTPPGRNVVIDQEKIARHVMSNPAYAVRYAHSRAASVPRWAPAPARDASLNSGELELAYTLSWLPERVAVAARRGRPDEFARYLEELAYGVIARVGPASNLELVAAARTGLAAGLGLLGISAPDRLLPC